MIFFEGNESSHAGHILAAWVALLLEFTAVSSQLPDVHLLLGLHLGLELYFLFFPVDLLLLIHIFLSPIIKLFNSLQGILPPFHLQSSLFFLSLYYSVSDHGFVLLSDLPLLHTFSLYQFNLIKRILSRSDWLALDVIAQEISSKIAVLRPFNNATHQVASVFLRQAYWIFTLSLSKKGFFNFLLELQRGKQRPVVPLLLVEVEHLRSEVVGGDEPCLAEQLVLSGVEQVVRTYLEVLGELDGRFRLAVEARYYVFAFRESELATGTGYLDAFTISEHDSAFTRANVEFAIFAVVYEHLRGVVEKPDFTIFEGV